MTTKNRLAKSENPTLAIPQEERDRRRFWIERGNAYLWGDRPADQGKHAGQYIDKPRRDLEWICNKNGSYSIVPRFSQSPSGR
jgi:hypothetical protein